MNVWRVEYHKEVILRDLQVIDAPVWNRIRETIDNHYAQLPSPGKPLTHGLRLYRTLRIGDFRAICHLRGEFLIVFVVRHRNKGYGSDLLKLLKRRNG